MTRAVSFPKGSFSDTRIFSEEDPSSSIVCFLHMRIPKTRMKNKSTIAAQFLLMLMLMIWKEDHCFEHLSAILLAARSSFFAALLSGIWTLDSPKEIHLQPVPVVPFERILKFIHLEDELGLTTVQEILDVLQWAFYFGV